MISGVCAGLVWLALMGARGAARVVLWNLPATMAHELSHWLVALVTGCRPGFPSIWPRRQPDGSWVLGAVAFNAKPHFAAWVALAPLFLALVAGWGLLVRHAGEDPLQEAGLGVIFGFLAWGSLPSSQDWSVALKHPLGMLTALTVFFAGGYALLGYF